MPLSQQLEDAIIAGNINEITEELGSDRRDWNKAFQLAALNGRLEILRFLLDKTPDETARNNMIHSDGECAFQMAAENGCLRILQLLLDETPDETARNNMIHSDGDYAFQWATKNGHFEILQLLLDETPDETAKDILSLIFSIADQKTKIFLVVIFDGAIGQLPENERTRITGQLYENERTRVTKCIELKESLVKKFSEAEKYFDEKEEERKTVYSSNSNHAANSVIAAFLGDDNFVPNLKKLDNLASLRFKESLLGPSKTHGKLKLHDAFLNLSPQQKGIARQEIQRLFPENFETKKVDVDHESKEDSESLSPENTFTLREAEQAKLSPNNPSPDKFFK